MSDDRQDDAPAYLDCVVTSYVRDPALTERNRRAEEGAVRGEADNEEDGPAPEADASEEDGGEEQ